MQAISNYILPLIVLIIVSYGIYKKVDVYDVFIDGAKESFDMIFSMFPCLLAMIFSVNIFLKGNVIATLFSLLEPFFSYLKVPIDVFPMMLMRPISGTSSLAILNNILENFGPDSFVGRLASIIQGSTDTTFYILTLYFGSIGIKKIRHSLFAGLAADLAGILAAIFFTSLFFH